MQYKLINWGVYETKETAEKHLKELKKEGHIVEIRKLSKNKKYSSNFKWGIYIREN